MLFIDRQQQPEVMEWIACSIIAIHSEIKVSLEFFFPFFFLCIVYLTRVLFQNMDISRVPLDLMPADRVQHLIQSVVCEFKLSKHFTKTKDEPNKHKSVPLELLKQICVISTDCDNNSEWLAKHKIYATSIILLVIDACRNDHELIRKCPDEIKSFIEEIIDNLDPTLTAGMSFITRLTTQQNCKLFVLRSFLIYIDIDSADRIAIFCELLKCVDRLPNEESKDAMAKIFNSSFEYRNSRILHDLISALCCTLDSMPQFALISEKCLAQYFQFEGMCLYC